MKDFYGVLGVRMEDSVDAIRQAYRKLAKQFHPDLNPGNRDAEERFKEIGIAWETLGNPEKRASYDASLKAPGQAAGPTAKRSAAPRKAGPPDFSDFMKGFQGFEDFLHAQNAQNAQRTAKTQAGNSTQTESKSKGDVSPVKGPIDTGELFRKFMGFK